MSLHEYFGQLYKERTRKERLTSNPKMRVPRGPAFALTHEGRGTVDGRAVPWHTLKAPTSNGAEGRRKRCLTRSKKAKPKRRRSQGGSVARSTCWSNVRSHLATLVATLGHARNFEASPQP